MPNARIELLPIFEKKYLISVDKKTLKKKPSSFQEIKNFFPAMFFNRSIFFLFRRPR